MNIQFNETLAKAKGQVQIRDWSLWIKHILGSPKLQTYLSELPENDTVELVVGGIRGHWVKKKNSPDGSSTPGLKPLGKSRDAWFDWYKTRRGELVEIKLASANNADNKSSPSSTRLNADTDNDIGFERASRTEQNAAWAAFESLGQAGWHYDGVPLSRDDLHERRG